MFEIKGEESGGANSCMRQVKNIRLEAIPGKTGVLFLIPSDTSQGP